ncbi:YkvA family protein [uncultured Marivirga sp.]|uniref:YkvA family protein n=1 Tax=uncultured Marivirga sp. TaxID=1123707 RepID=UPI0030ED6350|tara:strand:+ start:56354 stop:56752 length:399 start_codon:yes stop_codon:yes gene_type:complete
MSKRLNHKNAFRRATRVLADKRLSNKLLMEVKQTLTSRAKASEKIGQLRNKISTLIRLVKAYTKGSYKNISFKSMIYTVGVLIYFITPMDIVPDFIPVSGFIDDASLILWLYNHLGYELQQFKAWESKQEEK